MKIKNMREYIEMGEKKMGTQIALAQFLGMHDSSVRSAKMGKIGLPDHACIILADLIEEPRLEVIAASNLVTEKNADRRKIFESCFSKAAVIVLLVGVTMIVTPSPAHAAPLLDSGVAGDPTLYIMLNCIN